MSAPSSDRPGSHPGESDLSRTYILVILFEILVIAGLYALGRYFG
jgi:hypothetical protein